MKKLIPCLLATAGTAAAASAQDVAIVAAASASSTGTQFTEVERILVESARFDSVTVINTAAVTPTLDELLAFDSIIIWTNVTPINPALLGDTLADYVDAGGGVVVAVFANSSTTTDRDISGRWRANPDYEVIVARSGNLSGLATLGTILEPDHPIMAGVTTFSGGTSSFRPQVTALNPGRRAIAEWSDGRVRGHRARTRSVLTLASIRRPTPFRRHSGTSRPTATSCSCRRCCLPPAVVDAVPMSMVTGN